jgi:hypothetical protein
MKFVANIANKLGIAMPDFSTVDVMASMHELFDYALNSTDPDERRVQYAKLIGFYEGLVISLALTKDKREFVIRNIDGFKGRNPIKITNL